MFPIQTRKMRNSITPPQKLRLRSLKLRSRQAIDQNDQLAELITDAYATVAIAYRRASTAYSVDKEMQQLGTAAVHLLTIATSYVAAKR